MSSTPNDDADASSQFITAPSRLPALPVSAVSLDPGGALSIPLTPTTPTTPTTPLDPNAPAGDGSSRPKKTNPLTDLIETEKTYVELLTGIIRKVAAAWSRSNLPPPDLDTMFRSIESVYKANRSLLLKLKEIGTNPSSPKALGDLLMRWIDDLEAPYTSYSIKYRSGFDDWEPVRSNIRLPAVIASFSTANPPPSSASLLNPDDPSLWTLDALFLLPKGRLKYYKRLYSRLLKSTTPGRSDHRLLLGAIEKLEKLLETLEARQALKVGLPSSAPSHAIPTPTETEDPRSIAASQIAIPSQPDTGSVTPVSEGSSSARESNTSGARSSQETASTSISRASTTTMSMPISDLERRLSTSRTLDIFTMKPKVVRLQMLPPHLPFTREMRLSVDATIRFTPRHNDAEVVHHKGHIFLLSDLFLVCEHMTPAEKAENGGAEMWLCYPPLAGKVLRVSDAPGQDNALNVAIMRKETLTIELESGAVRNLLLSELTECIEFAGSVSPVPKQPPPPMPPLNLAIHSNNVHPVPPNHSILAPMAERSQSPPANGVRSNPPSLVQFTNVPNQERPQPPHSLAHSAPNPDVASPPIPPGSQRGPPLHHPVAGQVFPPPFLLSAGQQVSVSSDHMVARSPSAGPPGSSNPIPARTSSAGSSGPIPARSPSTGPPLNHPGPNWQPLPNQPYPGRGRAPYGSPGLMSVQYQDGALPPHMHNSHVNSLPPRPGPYPGGRAPSDPNFQGGLRKSASSRSLTSQYEQPQHAPPLPPFPGGYPPNPNFMPRSNSQGSLNTINSRSLPPSLQMGSRATSLTSSSFADPSPPDSPVEEMPRTTGPVTSTISAQMKCKVFLQQQHAQWKSLGSAKLKLYHQDPTNIKQLVVEADKDKTVLISTIVLTDGVERVGKTGVAIELSDNGARTGIIYMIQLRNETSAGGLFESLLAGSDRAVK